MIRHYLPDKDDDSNQAASYFRFIRSTNKTGSVWQYLKRYENATFVRKRLLQDYPSIGIELRNKKADHIADCIRQAEEYFRTASKSDLSIKPLILYYGMLDLVKALMMLGDNPLTLDDAALKSEGMNSHGLTHGTDPSRPSDAQIRDNPKKLLEEFCYTYRRSDSTIFTLLHSCWSDVQIDPGTRFSLGDLASSHPGSWSSFAQYTKRPPKYYKVSAGTFIDAPHHQHYFSFDGNFLFGAYGKTMQRSEEGLDFLESRMPRLTNAYSRETGQTVYGFRSKETPKSLDDFQPHYTFITGEKYTLEDIHPGHPLQPIEIEYLAMFILGSLARYAPQKWLKNVQYTGSNAMFIIEGIINSAPLSFPKMILEELDNGRYTFTGDLAYLG